jgi:CBS domain-containing protein
MGIITDGNLLARGGVQARIAIAERLDQHALQAQLGTLREEGKTAHQVMTTPVITVPETATLAHATHQMAEHNLKRLPVVDARGRLVGMISRVDVLRTVSEAHSEAGHPAPPSKVGQTVGEVMDRDVPIVALDTDLTDLVEKMIAAGLKRVIVVDGTGQAVGVITDGDLVARIAPEARPGLLQALTRRLRGRPRLPDVNAAQLMSPGVLSGPPDTPVVDAIQQMLAQKRKRFLVVDEAGKPLGMVDRQMLLRAVIGG